MMGAIKTIWALANLKSFFFFKYFLPSSNGLNTLKYRTRTLYPERYIVCEDTGKRRK